MKAIIYKVIGVILIMLFLLCGCTSGERETEPESNTEAVLLSGNPETEELVSSLWNMMLQWVPYYRAYSGGDEEIRQQWDREYSLEAYLLNISTIKKEHNKALTYYVEADEGFMYNWKWVDTVGAVKAELFPEAEKHLAFRYERMFTGRPENSRYVKNLNSSVFKISGKIKKISYEAGNEFIESMFPYYYYGIWGSVLKETGKIYEAKTGTILGELTGQAYMTGFDLEALKGDFLVFLEGHNPVRMEFRFENEDCMIYEVNIADHVAVDETEKEKAWLSFEFDLITETVKP